jgi:hypothetical protein
MYPALKVVTLLNLEAQVSGGFEGSCLIQKKLRELIGLDM